MPTRISTINRSITTPLTAVTQYLVCNIPNGDVMRQIKINHINYGYTTENAAPTAFGWGCLNVIQNREFQDGVIGYGPRFPDFTFAQGDQLYFDLAIAYGSRTPIDFNAPVLAQPGSGVIVVMPAAIAAGGVILADQVAYMTVLAEYAMVEEQSIGPYGVR